MSWLKTLVGGVIGFALGGPLGAILGASVASQLRGDFNLDLNIDGNQAFKTSSQTQQSAFFAATFSVMGHIAKLDGRVHPEAITLAKQVMLDLSLDEQLSGTAIHLFRQGKKSEFQLTPVLTQLYQSCRTQPQWLERFLRIQMQTAIADGVLSQKEEETLLYIARQLRISRFTYERVKIQLFSQRQFYTQQPSYSGSSLNEAYKTLGIKPDANMVEVKQAYRRLMSQHHPDKLAAKGLSEAEMTRAKEKTQAISKAYELIQKQHK